MSLGDVETFFHEFGHLMHWILAGRQPWAGIGGLTMEADFVEAPSMMLEELVRSPKVLGSFARHWQTRAAIPADLIAAANRASAFGRASYVAQQTSFSAISYDLYKGDPATVDLDAVTDRNMRAHVLYRPTPGTHFWAAFGHLGSYSSAYYTYMWDLEIAQDFWSQFDAGDPLAGDAPMRYRRQVLEPGGSMSANDLVKGFLGRPQNTTALLRWMGKGLEESGRAQAR
jgi:thimet oligopeptidase